MILKKLADLATKLDAEGNTKAASYVDDALMKIAQEFPEWEDVPEWDEEGPTDEELMRMEADPTYEPFEKELGDAKENRLRSLMTEMALFDEAVRSGQLTEADKETWNKIQAEFGQVMSEMGVGFGALAPGEEELAMAPIAEA